MLKSVLKQLKLNILNISSRDDLSRRYLKGSGLEIGAMHFPLKVEADVCVKYVDVNSRQENIARHPEIDGTKVVKTDFVEDGFKLASFADNSVDFVIANHVLEHSSNPLGTVQNWSRVLKNNGILFVSVPNHLKCFDKGRTLTLLDHIVKDYDAAQINPESLRCRNREHYREWIEISLPNARSTNNSIHVPKSHEKDAWIDAMLETGDEIHFHTFSYSLFRSMLTYYTSELDNRMKLIRIYNSSKYFEFTAILQKLPIA